MNSVSNLFSKRNIFYFSEYNVDFKKMKDIFLKKYTDYSECRKIYLAKDKIVSMFSMNYINKSLV